MSPTSFTTLLLSLSLAILNFLLFFISPNSFLPQDFLKNTTISRYHLYAIKLMPLKHIIQWFLEYSQLSYHNKHLIWEHFHHLKKSPIPISRHSPASLLNSLPYATTATLCLYRFAQGIFTSWIFCLEYFLQIFISFRLLAQCVHLIR